MSTHEQEPTRTIIDLGGPDGGRYWLVKSDHEATHPDAQSAAIYARVTGSVGSTYNDAQVVRLDQAKAGA